MKRQVNLNLQGLTSPQLRLCRSTRRFLIASWGRQSGKTTIGLHLMLIRALAGRRGGVYWYVLQTHSAAEIAFNRLWDILRGTRLLAGKPDESNKIIRLINGAQIFFKSGQNFEDLRAETLDGVIIDEYRQQSPKLWPMVIRPMLARHGAWAVILSTPNGFDHFYDLFEHAKSDAEWEAFHAPSTEAWWWSPEEIDSARRDMSEDEFAQEILAEFREMGAGKVYKNHGSWNQTAQNPFAPLGATWSPHLPLIVGLDFNVGLMCWEISQFKGRDSYTGDELAVPDTNTQECAPLLLEKVRHHKAGVWLIGDASGKARRSSATESDYAIIMGCLKPHVTSLRNLTPLDNPDLRTRINIVNAALKDANGGVHARYHPIRCKELKTDLERVSFKPNTMDLIFDKRDPRRTHASDAWGYPQCHFGNVWKPKAGKLAVISR